MRHDPQKVLAERFAARLKAEGQPAFPTGGGVHWHVDVGNGRRALKIHCFWYEMNVSALMLGMNPANARSELGRRAPSPYSGPEFFMILFDDGKTIADGRTRDEDAAAACVHAWLADVTFDALVERFPFVDEKPRALRAIATRVPSGLETRAYQDTLWVYDGMRACAFRGGPDDVSCAFHYGQAQLAVGRGVDVDSATRAWLVDRVPVRELKARLASVELERHAEWAETEPARWHWLHAIERARDPEDVLAPVAPLIERLATRPLPSSFFTFSSMWWLCFSASSHYPWVADGLPIVSFDAGKHRVQRKGVDEVVLCSGLDETIEVIERALAACPIAPFFGTAVDVEREQLARAFLGIGSPLRPELVRDGPWSRLVVAHGGRTCRVSDLAFDEGDGTGRTQCASLDELARQLTQLLCAHAQ